MSNITTADVIESKVATAIKVDALARVCVADPLPETTSALANVAANKKIKPSVANFLAAVVEKKVTKRTMAIGLTHHHGSDPGPPGFAKKAKLAPPPGIVNPISARSLVGLIKIAKDPGADNAIGRKTKVALRITLWIKSGLL